MASIQQEVALLLDEVRRRMAGNKYYTLEEVRLLEDSVNSFELKNESILCVYILNDENRIRMRDEVAMTPAGDKNIETMKRAVMRKVHVQVKADLDEIANKIPHLPIDMEATESCDGIASLSEDLVTQMRDQITVELIEGVVTPGPNEDDNDVRARMARIPWSFSPNAWPAEVMNLENGNE